MRRRSDSISPAACSSGGRSSVRIDSDVRRAEADTRATAHVVGRDLRGLVKVNPIAQWTDRDVDDYIDDYDDFRAALGATR